MLGGAFALRCRARTAQQPGTGDGWPMGLAKLPAPGMRTQGTSLPRRGPRMVHAAPQLELQRSNRHAARMLVVNLISAVPCLCRVDLRLAYSRFTNYPPMSINSMLQTAGLKFEGRLHSGIDDTRNIARILQVLIRRGHAVGSNANVGTTRQHLPWAQQQPAALANGGNGGGRAARGGR
eukprot:SAG11_NODE_4774_length_1770_cov_3.112507_1_plen_178_part_10